MNTKALVVAVTAACLASGAAFAQSYDYRNDGHERGTQYQRGTHSDPYDRDGNGVDDRVQRDHRYDGQRYDGQHSYNNRDSYARHQDSYPQTQVYSNNGYNNGYNNSYRSYSNGYSRDNTYSNAGAYQVRRGEYLPSQYRDNRYVVRDWRSHNLYQPQYGYQWVQAGNNDYAMVAIATGLIAAVLLNH